MIGRTIDELSVGDADELTRTARESDVVDFAASVGDRNPVHSDPAFAATTSFRTPIVPGIWTAGLISGVIGARLPGPGSIYETQDLRFLRPVRVGEEITARVEVLEIHRERNRARLRTTCLNQRGQVVLTGEAWVLPPKTSVHYREPASPGEALTFWALHPWGVAAQMLSWMTTWAALSWGGLAGNGTFRRSRSR